MVQKIITLLFLSGDPISLQNLSLMLGVPEHQITEVLADVDKGLNSIGLSLIQAADGISISTHPDQSELVSAFWKEELKGDLTPASLQVLTLVAYLGNGTREEISYIRGVQSSQSIRTLTVRGLITRNGEVCSLTTEAYKHLGITTKEELPDYSTISHELRSKLEGRLEDRAL
jgi:segregation and condensation protein B